MNTDRLPHLTCCATGARFVALRYDFLSPQLDREFANHGEFLAAVRSTPPPWTLVALDEHDHLYREAPVRFCPFCGAAVPALRLRASPPRRICTVTDGGHYCATCTRRLMECRCAPPERLWETFGPPAANLYALRAALVRLLWDSIADDAICTCCPGDVCPQCQATQALGLGRWRGARWAQRVLSPPDRAVRPPAALPRKRAARDISRSTHR